MEYDRDLRYQRHAAGGAAIINAVAALQFASTGHWVLAAIPVAGLGAALLLMDVIREEQRRRSPMR